MDVLNALFRWLHIIAGVVWIGHLYFFNFVNIPFAAKMKEAGASKTVVPELMPRALFWFRWGAAWIWITGVLLLLIVFYHGGVLRAGEDQTLGVWQLISLAIALGGFVAFRMGGSPSSVGQRPTPISSSSSGSAFSTSVSNAKQLALGNLRREHG